MKNSSKNNKEKSRSFVIILGINVSSNSKGELLKQVRERLSEKIHFYIVTPNPEIIVQAQSDPGLTHSLNSADFAIPDGNGLKLREKNLKIIKGREFMVDLFEIANKDGLKVYLLGGRDFVNKKALSLLASRYPNIIAKGNAGPELNSEGQPILEVDINLQSEIVKEINSFKPDFLFVAFGAPKQEKWIYRNRAKLKAKCIMAVGGSFDYFAGFVKSVPKIFESFGLEWLWRLLLEPKRSKRIFNATVVFPLMLLKDRLY